MFRGYRIAVAVPAAGQGRRMGEDVAKQFLDLQGKPILIHTLERLSTAVEIDEIVIAAPGDAIDMVRKLVGVHHIGKIQAILPGGQERQDSVWNCLKFLSGRAVDYVLVHDAVRPFIDGELLRSVCNGMIDYEAAIPVLRPRDTIKTIEPGGFVASTIPRDTVACAQTPQGFKLSLILQFYGKAMAEGYYGTDDSSLAEHYGGKVRTVAGSYANMKITTPEDLALAHRLHIHV